MGIIKTRAIKATELKIGGFELDIEPAIDLLKIAQYKLMIQRAYSEPFGYRRYAVKTIK